MAYIKQPFEVNKNISTNQSGIISPNGESSNAGNAGNISPLSQNWVNLNNYIDQNQGAGAGMADKILQPGQDAINNLSTAGSDFAKNANDQSSAGTKKDTAGYGDAFKSGNVSGVDTNAYKSWTEAPAYKGPADAQSATGYGDFTKQSGNAKELAGRSANQGMQYGLAKDTLGKDYQPYNAGMSMLDTILTRQAGGGEKLDKFNTDNSGENIDKRTNDITSGVNANIAANRDSGNAVTGNIRNNLQDRYTQDLYNVNKRAGINEQSTGDLGSSAEIAALQKMIELGANGNGANFNKTAAIAQTPDFKPQLGHPELMPANSGIEDPAPVSEWEKNREISDSQATKRGFDALAKASQEAPTKIGKKISRGLRKTYGI
jgi:hypothetical protein